MMRKHMKDETKKKIARYLKRKTKTIIRIINKTQDKMTITKKQRKSSLMMINLLTRPRNG